MATHSRILAWKIHGQRSLAGCSPCGGKESDRTEWVSTCTHRGQSHTSPPPSLPHPSTKIAPNASSGQHDPDLSFSSCCQLDPVSRRMAGTLSTQTQGKKVIWGLSLRDRPSRTHSGSPTGEGPWVSPPPWPDQGADALSLTLDAADLSRELACPPGPHVAL